MQVLQPVPIPCDSDTSPLSRKTLNAVLLSRPKQRHISAERGVFEGPAKISHTRW